MKPLSQILSNLIVLAEEVITRPNIDRFAFGERLADLAQAVRHAAARPAEDIRTTSAALVMITALEEYRYAHPGIDTSRWLMLAGCALPLLRADAFTAFVNEREQKGDRS